MRVLISLELQALSGGAKAVPVPTPRPVPTPIGRPVAGRGLETLIEALVRLIRVLEGGAPARLKAAA